MEWARSAGILLHPTSLPGRFGIGDLGPEAYRWVDWVAETECRLWQVLPLGPTGYADSPYQSFSSFAGNPYLVSPELLAEEGLLESDDLIDAPDFPTAQVAYDRVIRWKLALLDRAHERFERGGRGELADEFQAFRQEEADWLDEFVLFMAIKDAHDLRPWWEWPSELRHRDTDALVAARDRLRAGCERHAFRQLLFFRQWRLLHAHAAARGIAVVGDIPLYVAHDSADVWARPDMFAIDTESGQPTLISGVPPDLFSPNGQRWGNPQYRWEVMADDGYEWWIRRLQANLDEVDILRIDHFTGFAKYWEIPAELPTAEVGRWVDGPGEAFFEAVRERIGDAAIIAEDLGPLGDEVEQLRVTLGLPGMKVLQQAFGGDPDDLFLPHRYAEDFVAYTGTHDNNTARGWFEAAPEEERSRVLQYLGVSGEDIAWDMIRAVWASVALIAVAPVQDFLDLGGEARMNHPGTIGGNWRWRMAPGAASPELADRIAALNRRYDRARPALSSP